MNRPVLEVLAIDLIEEDRVPPHQPPLLLLQAPPRGQHAAAGLLHRCPAGDAGGEALCGARKRCCWPGGGGGGRREQLRAPRAGSGGTHGDRRAAPAGLILPHPPVEQAGARACRRAPPR